MKTPTTTKASSAVGRAKKSPAAMPAKAARPTAAVTGWSSEGGWATKIEGAKLRERPGEYAGSRSKSAQAFVLTLPADPVARATEVMNLIDRANDGLERKMDLDVKLALAWTTAVCAALGWDSIETRDRAGRIGRGLLSDRERRWVVDSRELMRRLLGLGAKGPRADNTALLLFNMIAAGNLPPAKPGDYLRIG